MTSTAETYDMTEEELRLFRIKHKQRQEAKTYFRSIINNPHRPINEGVVFDPVFYRFNTLIVYSYEHFKPTGRNMLTLFGIVVVPMLAIGTYIAWFRKSREKLYRSGSVSYKDRFYKNIF